MKQIEKNNVAPLASRLLTAYLRSPYRYHLLLLPFWFFAVWGRETFILPTLEGKPSVSFLSTLNWMDQLVRPAREFSDSFALWSDVGQFAMAFLATSGPILIKRRNIDSRAIVSKWTPSLNLLAAAAINGILLETTRILVQRPRPYVSEKIYQSAAQLTASDFTSFYSGHTSFCFAALVTLITSVRDISDDNKICLAKRMTPASVLVATGAAISVSTGVMRVLAGRHYLSDVLAGITMGVLAGFLGSKIRASSPHS